MLPFCRKQFGTKKRENSHFVTTNKSSIKNKRGVNKVLNDDIESSVDVHFEKSHFAASVEIYFNHPNCRVENRSEKNKKSK